MRDNDFFSWQRDMLHQLRSMAAGEEVCSLLQRETEALEYDYYTLCIYHSVPFTCLRTTFQSTYSRAWASYYQTENYFAIDPVLRLESFMRGHLSWEGGLFRDAAALWGGARDHSLKKGVAQCLTLPSHAQGFLSVSASSCLPGSYPDDKLGIRLCILTELSLLALLCLEDEMVISPEMKFNRRELEILKWTAERRTPAEVAMILPISGNTANFHQKNMQRKFNAPNKTQIACYAATTGLI